MTALNRIGSHRDILGECPTWDDRQSVLWWVDIRRPSIQRLDPASGRFDRWEMPAMIGALALTEGQELVVALGRKIAAWLPGTGDFRVLAQLPAIDGHRFNDGRADRQGRFWVGTMHNTTRAAEGVLYRLDAFADGWGLVPVRTGISIPNSLAWSPDGRRMYFADSLSHRIETHEFDPRTGEIGAPQEFAASSAPAFPDGATVDAEGHLWVAEFRGRRVVRLSPDGSIVQAVETPVDRPTACALGGEDLRTLFITTTCQNMTETEQEAEPLAGALLALRVDVPGLHEPRIALS